MLNKSYSYLVPLLNQYCKIDRDYYVMLDNVYTNHYQGDVGDIIILSYLTTDDTGFVQYTEELKSNELCQDYIDLDETVAIVFKFPDEFLYEYHCYKSGKFSEFTQNAKDIILKYMIDVHDYKDAARIRSVLNKEISLKNHLEQTLALVIDKDMELSSIPNEKLETFYI